MKKKTITFEYNFDAQITKIAGQPSAVLAFNRDIYAN